MVRMLLSGQVQMGHGKLRIKDREMGLVLCMCERERRGQPAMPVLQLARLIGLHPVEHSTTGDVHCCFAVKLFVHWIQQQQPAKLTCSVC